MIKLDRNTVFINKNSQGALSYFLDRHMHKRRVHLVNDLRRAGELLEIVPENSAAELCRYRGEAVYRCVERNSQNVTVDRLGKRGRKAKGIVPIASFCGGVYFRGVVKLHPAKLAGSGHDAVDKGLDFDKIVFVLLQTIYGIGVPHSFAHDHFAGIAGVDKLALEDLRVIVKHFVRSYENQGRRHSRSVCKDRGNFGGTRV